MTTTEQTTSLFVPLDRDEKQPEKLIAKEIKDCEQECKNYLNELLIFSKSNESEESKDFRKFEGSLFKQLLKMGNLLTQLYFEKKKGISVKK